MTTAKSAVTREAIMEAARNVFARKGYRGTTVGDLTKDLHVTRANFYYYYRDKEELFIALGTETYRESLVVIDALGELPQRPHLDAIRRWVIDYFAYLDRNGAFVARSMDDSPEDPEFQRTVARLYRKSARRLGEQILTRSSGEFSSAEALGMSIISMLERCWLLSHTAMVRTSPQSAIQSCAEILAQLMR